MTRFFMYETEMLRAFKIYTVKFYINKHAIICFLNICNIF
jgi:hypothetical protein